MDSLEWEHIWARYDRPWALRDVSLGVEAGRLLYLVGTPGGGKTTLLRAAGGELRPEAGRVWVHGVPVRRGHGSVLGIGETLPPALSLERGLDRRLRRAGLRGRGLDRRLKTALRAWELEAWRETRIRALSTSVLQRARLAAQWACPGAAWLLDNPTALLDTEWRERWPALRDEWRRREGAAVVVATNAVEEAMEAEKAAVLHAGRVAASGPPARLCHASGAEEIVVRTLDDAAAAAALSRNLRLEAERRADGLILRVRRADDTLPGVVQTLGSQLETVWVRRPTMQDAIAYHTSLPAPADLPSHPPPAHRGAR